ncbi:BspA family leucine-rich repeat surface protein [Lactococcus lactis subsp. hordniae]|nr:BspA family leucine-rich repeat surface protein [Lactococcus lactis subsp. hordniae]MCT3134003.1 BspA family leucine-rich repeat surface protein [Lactococcus lactis]
MMKTKNNFRTWKSGKKSLYSATSLVALLGGGSFISSVLPGVVTVGKADTTTTLAWGSDATITYDSATKTVTVSGNVSSTKPLNLTSELAVYFGLGNNYADPTTLIFDNATFTDSGDNGGQNHTFANIASTALTNVTRVDFNDTNTFLFTEKTTANTTVPNLFQFGTNFKTVNFNGTTNITFEDYATIFNSNSLNTVNFNGPTNIKGNIVTTDPMQADRVKQYGLLFNSTGLSTINVNAPLSIADSGYVFAYLPGLTSINGASNITLSGNVDSTFSNNGANFTSLDVTGMNTSAATDTRYLFAKNPAWSSITGLTSLNTANVNSMEAMFYNTAVNSLNVTGFNTSNVARMDLMFAKIQT